MLWQKFDCYLSKQNVEPKAQNLFQSQNKKFRYYRIASTDYSIFLIQVDIVRHYRNMLAAIFLHRTSEHNVEREDWEAKLVLRLRILFPRTL